MSPDSAAVPAFPARRMGVFIDADNLNDATALDHVFSTLHDRGDHVLYKRAYGRTESLRAIEPVLWRHGVRPVANMLVNKVTTDSALVIDAVEAVCSGAINAFALCSGDADFVPLATWAREKGCQVLCFSLSNRIFANPENFYDDVVLLEVVEPPGPVQAATAAIATASWSAALASRLAPCGSTLAESVSDSAPESTVQQVLAAFPALRTGKPQHLAQVVVALRQQGILGKTTKTTAWFARWSGVFSLTSKPAAHQITYLSTEQKKQPATAHAAPAMTPSAAPVLTAPVASVAPLGSVPALPQHPVQAAGMPALTVQKHSPASAPAVCTPLPVPQEVRRILEAVPALRHGPQMLCQLVPVLREKNILGQTARSTPFFTRLAPWFGLLPAHQPTQLVYLPPGNAVQAHSGQQEKKPLNTAAFKAATASLPATAPSMVLSWPTTAGRQPAPPLLAQLHGLRSLLLQRALQGVSVADVLLAVPELLQGRPCALSAVARRLRELGLLHSSHSALRILEQHPASFSVQTDCTPQVVMYLQ